MNVRTQISCFCASPIVQNIFCCGLNSAKHHMMRWTLLKNDPSFAYRKLIKICLHAKTSSMYLKQRFKRKFSAGIRSRALHIQSVVTAECIWKKFCRFNFSLRLPSKRRISFQIKIRFSTCSKFLHNFCFTQGVLDI